MGIESEEQDTKSTSDDGGKEELSASQPDIVIAEEEPAKEISDESEEAHETTKSESQERLNAPQESRDEEEQRQSKAESPQKQSIWNRLFSKGKKARPDTEAEGEAETELLSKEEMGTKSDRNSIEQKDDINEKKEENEKNERNGSSTDVTIAVSDEKECKKDTNTHTEPTFKWRSPYLRYALIALTAFFFLLVVIAIVTMQLAYQPPATEAARSSGAPLALTDCGQVHGRIDDGVYIFQGIPYAVPPVKDNRWEPTVPISKLEDCWSGIYMATTPRSLCYQKPIPNTNFTYSEDCLYINVYTPSLSQLHLLPVVVYVAGDSLLGLSEMDVNWMPSPKLAKEKNVVFVTFNYRTGPFGFMVLEAALREHHGNPGRPKVGNYGFHDQLSALNWVQKNIQQFGGDANKVTVLGHGSGATSGLVLLSTKKSRDLHLFNRMWLTGPSGHFSNLTLGEVAELNIDFQKKLGCDSMQCLREKSAEEVLSAVPESWHTSQYTSFPLPTEEPASPLIVVDESILYDTPFNVWKGINITSVPLVIGATAQEMGSYPLSVDIKNWTYEQLTTYMRDLLETLQTNLSSIVEDYFDNVTSTTLQYQTLVSDMRVVCPVQNLVRQASQSSQSSVYSYVVEYVPSSPFQMSENSVPAQMAVHGIDVAAIFGLLGQYVRPLDEADLEYQTVMQELFYSFVNTGEPMVKNHPLKEADYVNVIGRHVEHRDAPYGNCQFWEDFGLTEKYAKMN